MLALKCIHTPSAAQTKAKGVNLAKGLSSHVCFHLLHLHWLPGTKTQYHNIAMWQWSIYLFQQHHSVTLCPLAQSKITFWLPAAPWCASKYHHKFLLTGENQEQCAHVWDPAAYKSFEKEVCPVPTCSGSVPFKPHIHCARHSTPQLCKPHWHTDRSAGHTILQFLSLKLNSLFLGRVTSGNGFMIHVKSGYMRFPKITVGTETHCTEPHHF